MGTGGTPITPPPVPSGTNEPPMKGDLINDAYSQLRISGVTKLPTPGELDIALQRMENMLSEISTGRSICVGYNFEDQPDPAAPHNVDRAWWHFIATNLAIRLIPDFNKAVPPTLQAQANQSMGAVSAWAAKNNLRDVPYPSRQARGSGNTLRLNRWNRFYRSPGIAPANCETEIMQIGDVDDFLEHFDSYLNTAEDINTYTIEADDGLDIVSSQMATPDIAYRIEAVGATSPASNTYLQVKIVITTTGGRVETRFKDFLLLESDND